MTAKLLEIENLHAGAAGKEIIKGEFSVFNP